MTLTSFKNIILIWVHKCTNPKGKKACLILYGRWATMALMNIKKTVSLLKLLISVAKTKACMQKILLRFSVSMDIPLTQSCKKGNRPYCSKSNILASR